LEEPTGPTPDAKPSPSSRLTPGQVKLTRLFSFLAVVALSLLLVLYGNRLVGLGAYGYPGLFLLNLLSSATLILPAPGLALALAAGATLNPYLVGLAVGSGSTLGELTGYIAGASGRGMWEDDPNYPRVRGWMAQYGLWVIFFLSLVPNPIFDVAGIVSGAMHIPVWKFLAATWCGKVVKSTLVALVGAGAMQALAPLIERWMTR
jgi:membrane protein YqaA with SNARE-associated domain